MELILASQSPRRRELLGLFRLPFVIRVADIDETMNPNHSPCDEVARVSREKALAVSRAEDDIVIAADTIVVCEGKVLGKPRTPEEAVQMLRLLSGRDHQVMTGMTVVRDGQIVSCTEITDIHFRKLSQKEIAAYVATGEPMDNSGVPIWNKKVKYYWQDKAGGYGIQDPFGAMAVKWIKGDYYNVVGLPVSRLYQILTTEFGIEF